MQTINNRNLPKQNEWEEKALAAPNIPRGQSYPISLRTILIALKEQKSYEAIIEIEGSERLSSLEELCITLRPLNIVNGNSKAGWVISKVASNWLDLDDDLYLATILNANLKFFSEILYILSNGPCQIKDILGSAIKDYRIPWKTKQEISGRLNWLKDLSLIEYEDYSYNYSITELGVQFLKEVGYVDYRNIEMMSDETLNESEILASEWALELCKVNNDDKRKDGIGYFPGSGIKMHETLLEYLNLMNRPTNIQYLIEYSKENYSIKHTSFKSFFTPLKHLDFVEQVSKTDYQITDVGRKLSKENLELDFACCIHNKYNFIFEILLEIGQNKLNAKELRIIAENKYNFTYKDTAEIHRRIHILKNAKLIRETGADSYGLTNRGKIMKEILKDYLAVPTNQEDKSEMSTLKNEYVSSLNNISYELKDSSQDSTNPIRFEKALQAGFSFLGFKADHISGSGNTDVLLHAPTVPKFSYSVSIDAKSTNYNEVPEASVDFIFLNEHKLKHKADYAAVVGINFGQKSRLIKRAKEHNVLLIDINSLTEMIGLHANTPLNPDSYKKIFNQNGLINIQVLNDDRNKIKREGLLMQSIIDCLSDQSTDPYTKGIISAREIYFILKSDLRFEPSPNFYFKACKDHKPNYKI